MDSTTNQSTNGALTAGEAQQNDIAQTAQTASVQHAGITTPIIPEEVYTNLPDFLKRACEVFTSRRERDIFLTGALAILSGCFKNVSGVYDGRCVFANLFALIVAGAGRGKGTLIFARMLAQSIHTAMANPSSSDGQGPRKLFFIPANSSSAVLIKHLAENDGAGTICETEADTLTQTLKQDWGGYSYILRGGFQHEPVSSSRKKDNEYVEITTPKLSAVISGTQEQIRMLIPSTENGLFSRFMFYTFDEPRRWKDVSPNGKPDLTQHFNGLSEELHQMVVSLGQRAITFNLSSEQWRQLNQEFSQRISALNELDGSEDDTGASVFRLGLITYRIAMILTIIRALQTGTVADAISCRDCDFESAMRLSALYQHHAIHMVSSLPTTSSPAEPNIARFHAALPAEFTSQQAIQMAAGIGIKTRTVGKYLNLLLSGRQLQKVKHGHYKKV